ncbi:barstar family protein [Kitasatospora sp. NPDC086009]|uniref:barstar family protein n=1 Tax=unclassified Kitasatospora TaxID=2633591 RepID=UPI0037C7C245
MDIWTPALPWINTATRPGASWPLPPQGTTHVAYLDAARMRTGQGVFEEFSRALALPAYFGWNWNALSECLRDLHWIPAQHYLIVIAKSAQLLTDEPDEHPILLKILERAAASHSNDIGKSPTAFNILLE